MINNEDMIKVVTEQVNNDKAINLKQALQAEEKPVTAAFQNFVKLLVYDTLLDYFNDQEPDVTDSEELEYYGGYLFPAMAGALGNKSLFQVPVLPERKGFNLKPVYDLYYIVWTAKRSLLALLLADAIDLNALIKDPINIKYAVGLNLHGVKDPRTKAKIMTGDVSNSVIYDKLSVAGRVAFKEYTKRLQMLASATKEEA